MPSTYVVCRRNLKPHPPHQQRRAVTVRIAEALSHALSRSHRSILRIAFMCSQFARR